MAPSALTLHLTLREKVVWRWKAEGSLRDGTFYPRELNTTPSGWLKLNPLIT